MNVGLISNYVSMKGRNFTVQWADEGHSRFLWRWNEDHYPDPLVPVFAWIHRDLPSQAAPYALAEVEPPAPFRGTQVPHGFQYVRGTPLGPDELPTFGAKALALGSRCGGAGHVWERFAQPRTEAAVRALQAAPIDRSIAELSRLYHAAFHNTHIGGLVAFGPVVGPLQAMIDTLFEPSEAALLVQGLGQGSDSATMESNRAVAEMAGLALSDESVARIVRDNPEDALEQLGSEAAAREFIAAFDRFVDRYGWRAGGWDITNPTLREQPANGLAMVRQAMAVRETTATSRSEVLRRRGDAVALVESRLADRGAQPAQKEAFHALVGQLENYVAVREGRALWQLITTGSLRMALLRKGARMAAAGAIAMPEDIFFLLPEEIDAFFTADRQGRLHTVVDDRRAGWQSWLGDKPPAVISADPTLIPSAAAPPDDLVVHGLPGSRGRVTARARVLLDFAGCDALEPGEVLVCVMTSPPWTPLFAVASAIVTDSGGAFSHPAIAAREFGIPAVVGAGDATARIRTGDTITVDGESGAVRIEARG